MGGREGEREGRGRGGGVCGCVGGGGRRETFKYFFTQKIVFQYSIHTHTVVFEFFDAARQSHTF